MTYFFKFLKILIHLRFRIAENIIYTFFSLSATNTLIHVSLNWVFQILSCCASFGARCFHEASSQSWAHGLFLSKNSGWMWVLCLQVMTVLCNQSSFLLPSCPDGEAQVEFEINISSYMEINFLKRKTYWFKHHWWFFGLPVYNWHSVTCWGACFYLKSSLS